MPELPEVETTRRGLAPHLVGRRVASTAIYDPRLRWRVPADLEKRILGQSIHRIDRRSKYLLFRIGTGTLLVHLGMTGSLRLLTKPSPRLPHDHVDIVFDNGATLRYHDPRRFGAMLWLPDTEDAHPLLKGLGPEPFDPAFDAEYLWQKTRRAKRAIKLVVMDNRIVVGVGNIYANEALFRARIRPSTLAHRVARNRLDRLIVEMRATLKDAIAQGGSTLRDYVDSEGRAGHFQLTLFVYGREGEPCRICGAKIKTIRLGGRATAYCPRCQR